MAKYTKEIKGEEEEYFEQDPPRKVNLTELEEDIAQEESMIADMQARVDAKKAKLAALKALK